MAAEGEGEEDEDEDEDEDDAASAAIREALEAAVQRGAKRS